ncbi:vacuolar protein sorting-associated protein 33A [Daphnia magna]|uniref:vacuolar protein sorting-associated protein 33A n=1 Tax=Daphnia magna TaxID=35525 RepID=UPI0006E9C92C|nr:vacuolar protein sorting-associated protein 33A [Daphnia magna]
MAHLSAGKVNFGTLRELARKDLVTLLEKFSGTKAIFWDEELTGPIGLVAEYSFLKELDVVKMFQLKRGRIPSVSVKNILFITRPEIELMDCIADNLHCEENQGHSANKEYQLIFVSRRCAVCEQRLKDKGVYGTLTSIDELPIDFYTLDSDVISMELDSIFKDLYIDNETSSLHQIARGLMTVQSLYGIFPNIVGKGRHVRNIFELMTRMRRDIGVDCDPPMSPLFDTLMIIDRTVDLVTPVVTQLTYEGLIDEFYGIKHNTVKLPGEKFQAATSGGQSPRSDDSAVKSIVLNSAEELYADLRDKNFSAVGTTLSRKAKAISAQYEERHEAKTVSELKQFVAKLPQMQATKQSLALHTSIAELVKEITISEAFQEALQVEQDLLNGIDTDKVCPYIEDFICKQEPLTKVLRLICLQSASNSGLKPRVLEHYKREIIHAYGFQHMVTLHNLETCGLLRLQQSSRPFTVIRRALNLTVDDVNEITPTDISYVHSIYAPLSVRLVQWAAKPGWKQISDVLNLIPGPLVQETQPISMDLRRNSKNSIHSSIEETKVTLVFFLGGCTYAEISALRFLSKRDDAPTDYLIATTNIANGENFLNSLSETLNNSLV